MAAVPAGMPTSTSPKPVFSETVPRVDRADPDVAVGGAGDHAAAGPVDRDVAVGGVDPQVAGDQPDPAVAVGVLHHGRAVDLADLQPAGAGADVGPRRRPSPRRCGRRRSRSVSGADPVELHVAGADLDPARGEHAGGLDAADAGLGRGRSEPAGRSTRHVDRAGLAEQAEAALLGRLHQQPAVRVLDPGLLGGADVRVRARVARADLDDRVGPLGGDDPQVADDQLDGRGDGAGGVEGRHDGSPQGSGRVSGPSRSSAAGRRAAPPRPVLSARTPDSSAAAVARTSQALTERPARPAASSIRDLSESGSRKLIRAVAASSPSAGRRRHVHRGRRRRRLVGRRRGDHEHRLAVAQQQRPPSRGRARG